MPMTGDDVIQAVRAQHDTVLLAFSRGKDSIAAWLAIRERFPRVVPYYLYRIPGLEFVERSLLYYEEVMQRHIVRLPHPATIRQLNAAVFQPPERLGVIEAAQMWQPGYEDIRRIICEDQGLPGDTPVAFGVRAADNPIRRAHFVKHGAISWTQYKFYPVWDWSKDKLISEIRRSGIRLPPDYRMFGRSFDGLDLRFLAPLKKHYPRDYERVLEYFPLADLEAYRYEHRAA